MTRWKKFLVAASTGATMVVLATVAASASGTGRSALRTAGTHAVLAASMSKTTGQPGGVASGTGLGPIQISIGDRWNLQGPLIVHGTVTLTCGPFIGNSSEDFAAIDVEEALGNRVGHATGSVQLTCDGAHHSYPVAVLVNDVPFSSGAPAAASVQANACGTDSSFQFVCQSGSPIAPVAVK